MVPDALLLSALVVGLLAALVTRWCYGQRAISEATEIVMRLERSESNLYHADRDLRKAVQLFRTAKFRRDTGQRADPVHAAKYLAHAYRLQQLTRRSERVSVPGLARGVKRGVTKVVRRGA